MYSKVILVKVVVGTSVTNVFAISISGQISKEHEALAWAGFGQTPRDQEKVIMLLNPEVMELHSNPKTWRIPGIAWAHRFIQKYFEHIPSGWTFDVAKVREEIEIMHNSDAIDHYFRWKEKQSNV